VWILAGCESRCSTQNWGPAGPEGWEAHGAGIPAECRSGTELGPMAQEGNPSLAGIPVWHGSGCPTQSWGPAEPESGPQGHRYLQVVDLAQGWGPAWVRGGDTGGVCFQHSPGGRDPCRVWMQRRAGAWHGFRGGDPGGAWIWSGAMAWHSPRGREPGRVDQRLCRPMSWGLGKPAVLLFDCGMEEPSTI
jgi:hypothetical protein